MKILKIRSPIKVDTVMVATSGGEAAEHPPWGRNWGLEGQL